MSPYLLPGYNLINQPAVCSKHGGLMIYVKECFSYKIKSLYKKSNIWEGVFIEINSDQLSKPITIGNVYRPPYDNNSNHSIENFIQQFTPVIDKLSKNNLHAVVVGDFNIDLLKVDEREIYGEFLDLMCTHGLFPKITLPSPFAKKSCSLIDQIYCKFPNPNFTFSPVIVKSHVSDHCPCATSINLLQHKQHKPKYIKIRKVNENQIEQFKNEILKVNLAEQIDHNLMTYPNRTYAVLEGVIKKAKDECFPEITVRFHIHKHKLSEWITSGILKSIQFRDNLYKNWKLINPESHEYLNAKHNLKVYNGILNRNIRLAKKGYYARQFEKYRCDIRKTWDTLQNIINKLKSKSVYPNTFFFDGRQVNNITTIANKFNEYFTAIGSDLADAIDTSGKPIFSSYLRNASVANFTFTYTNSDEVLTLINGLKPKHSSGHDEISSKLLKDIGVVIAPTLSVIINQSLCTGVFPDKLKIAKVIPLFKKGDESLIENYRPISLFSSISKVFERIVFNQLYKYLDDNNLLFDSQYGFRKHHSTELAAVELIDRIYKTMDQGDIPISIFLDLSKAFDTLDHSILLNKLEYYGVKGSASRWFSSYLTGRYQYVDMEGVRSEISYIKTGVPQGSILGPLLFILYVNDMHTISEKFAFITYADDTTLTCPLVSLSFDQEHTIDSISRGIDNEMKKVTDWLAVNKLSLNVSKTKYMLFHFSQRTLRDCDIPKIRINEIDIERVDEFDFLGLTINENMTWNSHIRKISNKISRVVGIMNRLKYVLPQSALKLMYDSLINSHLQFCTTAWGYQCNRVTKLQKRALRIMCGAKYNAHTEPLLKGCNILKLKIYLSSAVSSSIINI